MILTKDVNTGGDFGTKNHGTYNWLNDVERDLVLLTWTLLPVVNPDLECYALGWFPLFTNTEKMLRRAKRTTGKENKNSQQTQIINPDKQSLKWDKITLKECKRGNVKIERIDIQIKRKH